MAELSPEAAALLHFLRGQKFGIVVLAKDCQAAAELARAGLAELGDDPVSGLYVKAALDKQ